MADRNPSKKRRAAQNKAVREERAARAAAAKTDAEERRAARQPDPVVSAKSPIVKGGIDEDDDRDDGVDESAAATPAAESHASVFSARRKTKAGSTPGSRPARTATGVVKSTGVAEAAPGRRAGVKAKTAKAQGTKSQNSKAQGAKAGSTKSGGTSTTRSESSSARTTATRKAPGRPLPAWLDRFGGNEPGGKWVLLSFAFVLIATVVVSSTKVIRERVAQPNGKFKETGNLVSVWQFGWAQGLAFILPPVVAIGLAIALARRPDRRRTWNYGLAAVFLLVFIQGLVYPYLFAVGSLALGCWQARKAALEEVGGDPKALRLRSRELRLEARQRSGSRRRRGSDG